MKTYQSFCLLMLTYFFSTAAHSVWSSACLQDCFSTGHECQYCAWACTREEKGPRPVIDNPPCDLERLYPQSHY